MIKDKTCNDCGDVMDYGEDSYCRYCYEDLMNEIDGLKEIIEELENP